MFGSSDGSGLAPVDVFDDDPVVARAFFALGGDSGELGVGGAGISIVTSVLSCVLDFVIGVAGSSFVPCSHAARAATKTAAPKRYRQLHWRACFSTLMTMTILPLPGAVALR